MICDFYGISDRAAAAIEYNVLLHAGLITNTENAFDIGSHKIKREKVCVMTTLQSKILDTYLRGLWDGRKYETLIIEEAGTKHFRR